MSFERREDLFRAFRGHDSGNVRQEWISEPRACERVAVPRWKLRARVEGQGCGEAETIISQFAIRNGARVHFHLQRKKFSEKHDDLDRAYQFDEFDSKRNIDWFSRACKERLIKNISQQNIWFAEHVYKIDWRTHNYTWIVASDVISSYDNGIIRWA